MQTAREVAGKVKVHIEVNSSVNYVTPVLLIRLEIRHTEKKKNVKIQTQHSVGYDQRLLISKL